MIQAIPGLITLAVENISSYLKGGQQQKINTIVHELCKNDEKIKEQLKQYKNELLMYGKYNLRPLKGVIDTLNSLHAKQSQYERMIYHWEYNFRKGVMDAMKYSFDIQMYLRNAQEEHVMSYKEAVKAARDFLDAIAILAQGRLPRTLFSDNKLREILQEVE